MASCRMCGRSSVGPPVDETVPDVAGSKTPADLAGVSLSRVLGSLSAGCFPSDPRDVGAGDADIGKLAIAEAAELAQARLIAAPRAEQSNEVGQHGSNPFPHCDIIRVRTSMVAR